MGSPRTRRFLFGALVLTATLTAAGCTHSSAVAPLRVAGNRLVADGRPVRLLGVNHSGTQDRCADNGGFAVFDGPTDGGSIDVMKSWHVNAVRLPLNEACWLGLRGIRPQFGGRAYRDALLQYVRRLERAGLYVILTLHVVAPYEPVAEPISYPMPDVAHSIAFWSSVAGTLRRDRRVLYDLYNEPYGVGWACWRDGCYLPSPHTSAGTQAPGYRVAGMQQLLDAVRAAGARQPVLVGGLSYANDLTGWWDWRPRDPAGALVASLHVYPNPGCVRTSCSHGNAPCDPASCGGGAGVVSAIAEHVPVVLGEIGEFDCTDRYIAPIMQFADAHGWSYLAWTWNAGTAWRCDAPTLIVDYDGAPTAYGAGFRRHLQDLAGR